MYINAYTIIEKIDMKLKQYSYFVIDFVFTYKKQNYFFLFCYFSEVCKEEEGRLHFSYDINENVMLRREIKTVK